MKIKNGFVLEKVGDSWLAVAVGELATQVNALIKLNGSGAFLWELIAKEDLTESEMVDRLLAEYDVDREIAERDIASFVATLVKGGIIDD